MGCQTLGMSRSCQHVSPIDPKVNPREIVFTSRVLGFGWRGRVSALKDLEAMDILSSDQQSHCPWVRQIPERFP